MSCRKWETGATAAKQTPEQSWCCKEPDEFWAKQLWRGLGLLPLQIPRGLLFLRSIASLVIGEIHLIATVSGGSEVPCSCLCQDPQLASTVYTGCSRRSNNIFSEHCLPGWIFRINISHWRVIIFLASDRNPPPGQTWVNKILAIPKGCPTRRRALPNSQSLAVSDWQA